MGMHPKMENRCVVCLTPKPPEFSRVVEIGDIGPTGLALEIRAAPEERRRLASRFGLEALNELAASARLSRLEEAGPGMSGPATVRLEVTFTADMVQSCVVTLEPVTTQVSEHFQVEFAPMTEGEVDAEVEVIVDVDAEDPPEPMLDGRIDAGEMVAQHLAMLVEPYPRAARAEATLGEANWLEHEQDRGHDPGDDSGSNSGPGNPFRKLLEQLKE